MFRKLRTLAAPLRPRKRYAVITGVAAAVLLTLA